jgi:hypothetical protein
VADFGFLRDEVEDEAADLETITVEQVTRWIAPKVNAKWITGIGG